MTYNKGTANSFGMLLIFFAHAVLCMWRVPNDTDFKPGSGLPRMLRTVVHSGLAGTRLTDFSFLAAPPAVVTQAAKFAIFVMGGGIFVSLALVTIVVIRHYSNEEPVLIKKSSYQNPLCQFQPTYHM